MDGNFLEKMIYMTGLPEDQVSTWIHKEMLARGKNVASLNEETLRELLADMIQELILAN